MIAVLTMCKARRLSPLDSGAPLRDTTRRTAIALLLLSLSWLPASAALAQTPSPADACAPIHACEECTAHRPQSCLWCSKKSECVIESVARAGTYACGAADLWRFRPDGCEEAATVVAKRQGEWITEHTRGFAPAGAPRRGPSPLGKVTFQSRRGQCYRLLTISNPANPLGRLDYVHVGVSWKGVSRGSTAQESLSGHRQAFLVQSADLGCALGDGTITWQPGAQPPLKGSWQGDFTLQLYAHGVAGAALGKLDAADRADDRQSIRLACTGCKEQLNHCPRSGASCEAQYGDCLVAHGVTAAECR
jgi:hypothetical protein